MVNKINKIKWDNVDNFESYEFDDPSNKGSGDDINIELLLKLSLLREKTGWPIVTHWQVGGCVDVDGSHGHSSNSYHLLKNGAGAADFHFNTTTSIRVQFYNVLNAGFSGIGCYYDWHWDNKLLPIGFHVDVRPIETTQIWKREKMEYIYLMNRW